MNNSIQTPLVSDRYIKAINEKWFIVSSDSLAPIMRRGYDLHCIPVAHNVLPEVGDFVVIECRVPNRKRVSYQVGFFEGVNNGMLTLDYDYEDLNEPIAKWSTPLNQIKRIYLVDKTCRIYSRMGKFYPTTPKRNLP